MTQVDKQDARPDSLATTHQDLPLFRRSKQIVLPDGRIKISKKGWAVRVISLLAHFSLIVYAVYTAIRVSDLLFIYTLIMPLSMFLNHLIAWVYYRNPAAPAPSTNLGISTERLPFVSVIVPVYNQYNLIKSVIHALYESTYKNIEVIVVNDGSKDGTKEVLDAIAQSDQYPNLKIIHKINQGKRKAIASGFYAGTGKYFVLIDSDSIVDKHAIKEFVKVFSSNPEIGGAVGHVKVVNSGKNALTKVQDTWYDFSFNIGKAAESVFGAVTCISGCLAAYRREAIENFVPYWENVDPKVFGSDKELTVYAIAPASVKTDLRKIFGDKFWVHISQKLMTSMAQYDDAEDRGLTAHTILEWKSVYVASAVGYTDVPENWRTFIKQQIRWKKGFLRTNFFVNSFFWRKHPLAAFKYYVEFISTIIAPLVNFILLFYVPVLLHNWPWTVTVLGASILAGFAQGLDYKFRDPGAKYWMYKPLNTIITYHVTSWLIFPAIWTYRRNVWNTRQ